MERQTPRFDSLQDYIRSEDAHKELFDIKEQFDEALWCANLERLCVSARTSQKKNEDFYRNRIAEMRSLNGKTALINILNYKGLPKFCDYDCDGTIRKNYLRQGYYSWFSREIYRTLWNWQDLCETRDLEFKFATLRQFGASCYGNGMSMGPDTMNSFWITFSAYLILNHGDTYKWNNFKNTAMFRDGENGRQRDRAARIKELIESDDDYIGSKSITEFAGLVHTVGNMILVPARYNGYRGTHPCLKDYFDLSLDNLRHDWDGRHLLGEDEETRGRNFIHYINTFFLWEYVDEDYEAIPLCGSHKKQLMIQRETGRLYPKNALPVREEIDELCDNINVRIRRRSFFMIAMFRIAFGIAPGGKDAGLRYIYRGSCCEEWASWNVSGLYKKILYEVFLDGGSGSGGPDVCGRLYSGYGEVVERIREAAADTEDAWFVEEVFRELDEQNSRS